VLLAKTDVPDPRLPGTIHTAAAEIRGRRRDGARSRGPTVRDDASVQNAVDQAVARFGGIDMCVNKPARLATMSTDDLPMKRFD